MADTDFSVPLVSFAYFKDNLLPPLHPDLRAEVGPIVDALTAAGDIVVRRNKKGNKILSSRWKEFPRNPSKTAGKEGKVFAPFATIADAKQTAEFLCNPSITPLSADRNNTAKPDSYAVRIDRPAKVEWRLGGSHWDDIIMPGETKKCSGDEDFNDNNEKIMGSLIHGMRETVHRRFMFGYTVEDTQMRVWFCSRSDIIVSEQFNFITNHSELVHLFLSIMFANPVDLGYDPTISVKYSGETMEKNVYNLTIHCPNSAIDSTGPPVFQAMETVANLAADTLRGRGTRVWRGFGPINCAASRYDSIVVKDCWISDDRENEGKILANILEAARKKDANSPVAKYVPLIKAHFLEVVCHGEVMVRVNDKDVRDHTFEVMRRGVPLPDGKDKKALPLRRLARSREPRKSRAGSSAASKGTLYVARQKSPIRYPSKLHYRIVFRSRVACRPIDTVNSVKRLLTLLSEVLHGLRALHELGWIHRDICPGNILAEGTDGPAKIADLEFCKRIDDPSGPHDGRTGTPFFIPIEIDSLRYRFLSRDSNIMVLPELPPDDDASDAVLQDSDDFAAPFTANPLHDLESFWWLAVYLTLPRSIVGKHTISAESQKKNEQWATSLFTETSPRESALEEERYFKDGIREFHRTLNYIGLYLDQARAQLTQAYRDAEINCHTTAGIDVAATTSAHPEFDRIFSSLRDGFAQRRDYELSKISKSYLCPSMQAAEPVTGSLDPKTLLQMSGKRRRDSGDSAGDVNKITSAARVLASLPRESPALRRSKRTKHEHKPLSLPTRPRPNMSNVGGAESELA